MKKYRETFKLFDTEAEARSFCEKENTTGSAYKRNRYPATVTPWSNANKTEHGYIAWYHV
jgi:hypothetical protein